MGRKVRKAIKSAKQHADVKLDAIESTIHDLANQKHCMAADLANVLHQCGWNKGEEEWSFAAWLQTDLTNLIQQLKAFEAKSVLVKYKGVLDAIDDQLERVHAVYVAAKR